MLTLIGRFHNQASRIWTHRFPLCFGIRSKIFRFIGNYSELSKIVVHFEKIWQAHPSGNTSAISAAHIVFARICSN